MPLEPAELLALALALEEDGVPTERAVEELAAGAEGSVVALTAAYAHAASLARALPYDEQARQTVALLQRAVQLLGTPQAPTPLPEDAEAWLRAGRGRREAGERRPGRTVVERLAELSASAATSDEASEDEQADAASLAADLERLRSSVGDDAGERRRGRWWKP